MIHHEVVIIGAGISGCAAAKTLINNGINDIVILEATNRIGGRVKTVTIGKDADIFELGAQWIHGQVGNPLYAELHAKALLVDKEEVLFHKKSPSDQSHFFHLGGKKVEDALVDKAFEVSELLDERIKTQWDSSTGIGQFRDLQVREICEQLQLTEAEQVVCKDILAWVDISNKKVEALSEWTRTEHNYDSNFECDNKNFSFTQGVYSIFEHLLLPFVEEKIKLNVEVSSVVWSSENTKVQLYTSDGVAYTANHVVVTSSLGYLKANHQLMFTPSLPAPKVKAIQNIWMGTSEKLIFHYEQPLFAKEKDVNPINIAFLAEKANSSRLSGEMFKILGSEALWWQEVSEIYFSTSRAFCVFLNDKMAREASEYADDKVIEVVCTLIRHYTGLNVPLPSNFIRSNWGSDKYFLGSYSSDFTPNQNSNFLRQMMEPIYCNNSPAVLFAGEAYHHKWMSTLHGAYDTGIQQANKISQYILGA